MTTYRFSDDLVNTFINGKCRTLALALHHLGGLELVSVHDSTGELVHVGVRDASGQAVDIEGAWTDAAWAERWSELLGEPVLVRGATTEDLCFAWRDGCLRRVYEDELTLRDIASIILAEITA